MKISKYRYGIMVIFLLTYPLVAEYNPFNDTFSKIQKDENIFLSTLKLEAEKQAKNERFEVEKSKQISVQTALALEDEKEKVRSYVQRRTVEYKAYEVNKAKINAAQHLKVTATAYTSHKDECNSNPNLGAWDNPLVPGSKSIAVSQDLLKKYRFKNGTKVKITGLEGTYFVRDTMHDRYKNRIDIYMGMDKNRALRWGEKRVIIHWD